MKQEYSDLYDKFSALYGHEHFDEMAHFVGMKGKYYNEENNLRMLLVGRSTNGWLTESKGLNAEEFGKQMESVFKNNTSFDWIKSNPTSPESFSNGEKYRLSTSPFWNYTKDIWSCLNEIENKPVINLYDYDYRWFEFIAWTNIYKITEQGKTPGTNLTKLQEDECRRILKEEIDTYKPTFILMEIDDSWFYSFSSLFSDVKKNDDQIVKVTARYNNCPVIVTVRPENQEKQLFVESVVNEYLVMKK